MEPSKVLKGQKHDTHLFVEVNQATNAWSLDSLVIQFVHLNYYITSGTSAAQKHPILDS